MQRFQPINRTTLKATEALIKTLDPSKIEKFIHMGSVAAIDGKELENKNIYPKNSDDWYRLSKFRQQVLIEKWATENCVPTGNSRSISDL